MGREGRGIGEKEERYRGERGEVYGRKGRDIGEKGERYRGERGEVKGREGREGRRIGMRRGSGSVGGLGGGK